MARPERDPRDDLPKPIFKKGVLKLEDLVAGMELKGTVLNVVDFGAFVDIGLKDSGLVHISQLANRYIKSPHDVVSVGDVVTIWVMGVDGERKRVSLTMVKPGTERPRAERGCAPRGGQATSGARKGKGQAASGVPAAGPGRGPRREMASPSNLTSPAGRDPAPAPGGGRGPAPATRPPRPRRGPREQLPAGRGRWSRRTPARAGRAGLAAWRGGPARVPDGRNALNRPGVPPKPAKPLPPPPPLSKDALAGSVPLRSFGQLKQLWQAKDDDGPEPGGESSAPPAIEPTPEPS